MNVIGSFQERLLANFLGRASGLPTDIVVKVKKPSSSMVIDELVDNLSDKVIAFLRANGFSGNEILKRVYSVFTPMPSYVEGLNEKLLSIDSGGDLTSSNFEASLLKINNEYRLFMILSREGDSSGSTIYFCNIRFPVDNRVIKDVIRDFLLNGSYALLGQANLRRELREQNKHLDFLCSQDPLAN